MPTYFRNTQNHLKFVFKGIGERGPLDLTLRGGKHTKAREEEIGEKKQVPCRPWLAPCAALCSPEDVPAGVHGSVTRRSEKGSV